MLHDGVFLFVDRVSHVCESKGALYVNVKLHFFLFLFVTNTCINIVIEVQFFKSMSPGPLQKVCIWVLTPPPPRPLCNYFSFSSDIELYLRSLSE